MKGRSSRRVFNETRDVPKAYRLGPKDFKEHGNTTSCPGCRALLRGPKLQKPSDTRRQRFGEALASDERVQKAKVRNNAFIDQALEQEEGERAKRLKNTHNAEADAEMRSSSAGAAQGSGMTDEDRKESLKRPREGDEETGSGGEDEMDQGSTLNLHRPS